MTQLPENPEVIDLTGPPEEEPEQEIVPAFALQHSEIGDVFQQGSSQPIPEGWHELDGSRIKTREWPQFAAAMKIQTPVATLPKPERVLPGQRWIIKLGKRKESNDGDGHTR